MTDNTKTYNNAMIQFLAMRNIARVYDLGYIIRLVQK